MLNMSKKKKNQKRNQKLKSIMKVAGNSPNEHFLGMRRIKSNYNQLYGWQNTVNL